MGAGSSELVRSGLVFLGAGAGGVLRYWLGGLLQLWWGPTFPVGTLVVNLSGCLAIGFLATAWSGPVVIRDDIRQGVLIGVIGGYTTFSSFGRETLALAHEGAWFRSAAYVVLSVALGLLSVWAGGALASRFCGMAGA